VALCFSAPPPAGKQPVAMFILSQDQTLSSDIMRNQIALLILFIFD
jgi:hypothetical protein